MDTLTLDRISDSQLDMEYRKRFFLKSGDKLQNAEDAAKHFNILFGEDPAREHFGIIYLNGANKVINSEILFTGSLTTSAVYPREVIKRALEENAAAIEKMVNGEIKNIHEQKIKIIDIQTTGDNIILVLGEKIDQ